MRATIKSFLVLVSWLLIAATVIVKAGIWIIPNILMPRATGEARLTYNQVLLTAFTLNDTLIDPAWSFIFGLVTTAVQWTTGLLGMNEADPAMAVAERTRPAALIVEIVKNPLSWVYIIGAILLIMLLWNGGKKTGDTLKNWVTIPRILTIIGIAGLGYILTNQGLTLAEQVAPIIFIVMLVLIGFMFAPKVTDGVSELVKGAIPLVITALLVFFAIGAAASVFSINIADVIRGFIGDNSTFAFIPSIAEAGQNSMARVQIPSSLKLGLVFLAMVMAVPAFNSAKKAYAKKPSNGGHK